MRLYRTPPPRAIAVPVRGAVPRAARSASRSPSDVRTSSNPRIAWLMMRGVRYTACVCGVVGCGERVCTLPAAPCAESQARRRRRHSAARSRHRSTHIKPFQLLTYTTRGQGATRPGTIATHGQRPTPQTPPVTIELRKASKPRVCKAINTRRTRGINDRADRMDGGGESGGVSVCAFV